MGSKIVVRWVVPFVALVSASAALAACSIDTSAPQVTVIVQQGDGGAASSPLVLDGGAPGSPVVDAGAEADASVDGHADGDAALAVDASIDLDASDASAELHFTGEAGASNWEQLGSLPTPGLGFGLDEFVPSGASELEAHSADAGYVYDIADGTWRTADPDPGVITGGYARARGTTYGMTSSLVVSHTEADDRWTALAFLGAPGTTFAITSAAVA
ncbi:MAG TPA: hypothetical protein VF407_12255, partial [Polyangiaceae bacterium]